MLGLAGGLAVRRNAIVIDEMSLGLAPMIVKRVFENVRTINERGITVVLIEQFVRRALALADRCVILTRGSVAWDGTAAEARSEVLDAYLGDAHVR
jgi:branched-chain amino acid transport system ATP-binding protein